MATRDASWFGTDEGRNELRGRLFELACLLATSVGIVAVFGLLAYVTVQATRPLSADPAWHAIVAATVVLPTLGLAAYCYRADRAALEVAYTVTGLPVVGLLVAGGFLVLFAELLAVETWFALVLATVAAVGAIYAHGRLRPNAASERLAVLALVPLVVLFGAPPRSVALLVGVPYRIRSLREVVLLLPYLPLPSLQLVATMALPAAAAAGWFLARRREDVQAGAIAAALILAVALLGLVVEQVTALAATTWIVLVTTTAVPVSVYVAEAVRRREGVRGLVVPAALVAGTVLAYLLVQALGVAGPNPWIDWSFLTSPTHRTPELAGIYPALVGTVLLLVVVVVATFPVGVGAALYLEEYAPQSGPMGKLVTLIEINIANLAGVPSVVYGLLGLALFIRFFTLPSGSALVGGLAVGLLILPIVIIHAQEAIEAVPDSERHAAYGMGATRWQTIRTVVLPQAAPGILTGTIIAMGRAIGETAPLLMVGMAASVRLAPGSFLDQSSAMPRQIFSWAFEIDPDFWYGVLAAGVVTLLAVLLVMNATAILIRNRYERDAHA